MLGGKPLASLKEFLENTSIVEATKQFTVDEMLKETLSDFQKLILKSKKLFKLVKN